MNRFMSSFLIFSGITAGCLAALFFMTREPEAAKVQMTESVEEPMFAESETESEAYHLVLNQESVAHEIEPENYCLVAEEGYLIVYNKDRITVNMFTHMPLRDFPEREQERLMEGIWFGTMAEIFSYLESYTS